MIYACGISCLHQGTKFHSSPRLFFGGITQGLRERPSVGFILKNGCDNYADPGGCTATQSFRNGSERLTSGMGSLYHLTLCGVKMLIGIVASGLDVVLTTSSYQLGSQCPPYYPTRALGTRVRHAIIDHRHTLAILFAKLLSLTHFPLSLFFKSDFTFPYS